MRKRGFTIIELGMVVVVVAIIVAISLPDSSSKSKMEAELAADVFEADVAYARSQSIASPDDPIVIRLDADNNQYWLGRKSDPSTPIAHPQTGKPYVVQFGKGGKQGLEDVQMIGNDFGGDAVLAFDACGNTDQVAPAVLQLSAGSVSCEILVQPSAGKTTTSTSLTKSLSLEGTMKIDPATVLEDPAATGISDVLAN